MRTSFTVSQDVLDEFDAVWEAEGIDNRSRAVREAMLEYVEGHTRLEDQTGEVIALIGFDYRHHEVIEALHGVQHEYQDVILNTSHTHQGEWCLESLFCRGPAQQIRELTYRLRDFDAVRRVKVMLIQDSES